MKGMNPSRSWSGKSRENVTGKRARRREFSPAPFVCESPFSVRDRGFVPAGGLAIGNAIVTRAGPDVVVAKVAWKRHIEGVPVYNFEVEDDHTYFVGKAGGGVWVHNPGPCDGKVLPLGVRIGPVNENARMQVQLIRTGTPAGQIDFISDPRTYMEWMDSALSIHFNLQGTSAEFLAANQGWTAQEWNYLINTPALWPKSTVYNVPAGVSVPPGLTIGPSF